MDDPPLVDITLALIRKRAEHHDGCLYELEELALPHQHIRGITLLGQICPALQYLSLAGNKIDKLQGLHRLKELLNLNLAINCIERIENLEGCESLEKLDLTLNKVEPVELLSVATLQGNRHLRSLCLMGNPCEKWHGYRHFVTATLPQLRSLDSNNFTAADHAVALQNMPALRDELMQMNRPCLGAPQKIAAMPLKSRSNSSDILDGGPQRHAESKGGLETEAESRPQCNQGKWQFRIDDEKSKTTLNVWLGKYASMADVKVDVQLQQVTVTLKVDDYVARTNCNQFLPELYPSCGGQGLMLRLNLPDEVDSEKSAACHSPVTGILTVTMPLLRVPGWLKTDGLQATSSGKWKGTGSESETCALAWAQVNCSEEDAPPLVG